MSLRPGKGLHSILNQSVLDFIESCLDDISQVYNDDLHDEVPGEIIKRLVAGEGLSQPWTLEKDKFGTKAFRSQPYKSGEHRVTVVLTGQQELRLDIREWFEPEV